MKTAATILIVDDDPAALELLHHALKDVGQLRLATGGAEALAVLAKYPIDLALLDANMPGMDGFATCRAIQQIAPGLPVIFVTAASDFANEIRALEAGASDFISKPINPPVVRARVGVHLKLKAQTDQLRASLADIERHHAQMVALNRMNNLLLSCQTRDEACQVIASGAGEIFAGGAGGLAVQEADTAEDQLRVVATWGQASRLPPAFPLQDCWAFRHGDVHEVRDPRRQMPCRHFITPPETPYLCIPLDVRGKNLGLLHVQVENHPDARSFQGWSELARKVSGSIKLALFNLQLQEILRQQSIHDPLTGMFNRFYLDECLPRELRRCQRSGEPLTVAMLDLDHFKGFNDTFGHEAGDAILRAVGELLVRSTRVSDQACRYGGEELMIILPGSTLDHGRARLEYLREAIAGLRVSHRGADLPPITVSIGLADARPGEVDATALLHRADAALYQAKHQGRNRLVVAAVAGSD